MAHSKHSLKKERRQEERKGGEEGRESRKKQSVLFDFLSRIRPFLFAHAGTLLYPEDLP